MADLLPGATRCNRSAITESPQRSVFFFSSGFEKLLQETDSGGRRWFLCGGGKTGVLMRDRDWSTSSLGPPETWPQPLKTLVGMMLASAQPMFVVWGGERICLYNDGYAQILGDRHPGALAQPFAEIWPEIIHQVGPLIDRAYAGEPTTMDDAPLVLLRHGRAEETYFTFSYSPVRDEANVILGMFSTCIETTERVRAEQAVRAQAEELRALLDAVPSAIWISRDPDCRQISGNRRAHEMLRIPLGDNMSKSLPDTAPHFRMLDVRGDELAPENMPVQRAARGAVLEDFEARIVLEDQTAIDVLGNARPLYDAGGQPKGAVCALVDITDRKKIEGALQSERDHSVEILESISDAFYALDAGWRVTYANGKAQEWWALTAEDLLGKAFWEVFPQAVGSEAYCAHLKAMTDRVPVRLETLSPILNHWVGIDIHPIASGGLSVYFRDISARKAAEAALHGSEAHLRAIVEQSAAGISETDLSGRFVAANDRFCEIVGRSRDELLSLHIQDITHAEDVADSLSMFERSVAQGQAFNIEKRYVRPDGAVVWVLNSVTTLRDRDDRPVSAVCVTVDITARVRAQQDLRDVNEALERRFDESLAERKFWADLFERTDALVSAVATDRRVLAVNKACADVLQHLFGARPKVGDDIGAFSARQPEIGAPLLAAWDRALSGEQFTLTEEWGDPNRERPYFELRFTPLHDREGRLIGASQYAIDVTERLRSQAELAQAQEALRQSQKLESMGQLTGGVAHDFNNLLTPIIGSLDLIHRKGVNDERATKLVDGALQSAERAKTLVQRLLAFARRQPLRPISVDVSGLVESMTDLIASTSGPRIRVETDLQPDLPPVNGDPNQLEMALLNLSVNARDAMPDGGTLTIAAAAAAVDGTRRSRLAPGQYVRLSVSDTGIGMDEATLARAVEPFFSTKGLGKGTGLGLSMVHGLAAQLGGGLKLKSRPGLGTCVEIWLPLAQEGPTNQPPTVENLPERSAGTVLLVDDEALVRASTAAMLTDLGYAVVEVASAEEALVAVEGGLKFDVLVTDHLMPGMSGTVLARELRNWFPDKPALVVSGYAEDDDLSTDLPRLVKPFRQSELASSLGALRGATGPNPKH